MALRASFKRGCLYSRAAGKGSSQKPGCRFIAFLETLAAPVLCPYVVLGLLAAYRGSPRGGAALPYGYYSKREGVCGWRSKLRNVAKYRHFDFDTGFDTDTHAKVPVFGGGEEGVTKRNVFDTGYRACVPDRGVGDQVSAMSSSRKPALSLGASSSCA